MELKERPALTLTSRVCLVEAANIPEPEEARLFEAYLDLLGDDKVLNCKRRDSEGRVECIRRIIG